MSKLAPLVVFALCLTVTGGGLALGASGGLDPSFGVGGVVVRAEATEGLGDGRRYTATVTGREGFGRDAFDEMQTIETELEDFAGAIRTGGDVLASSALAIEVTDTLEKIDAALR
jgi:outer membrane receptor protein involved in Fe transport